MNVIKENLHLRPKLRGKSFASSLRLEPWLALYDSTAATGAASLVVFFAAFLAAAGHITRSHDVNNSSKLICQTKQSRATQ